MTMYVIMQTVHIFKKKLFLIFVGGADSPIEDVQENVEENGSQTMQHLKTLKKRIKTMKHLSTWSIMTLMVCFKINIGLCRSFIWI